MVARLFSHITQRVLLVLLQGCFKKDGIQFKRNNVLRRIHRRRILNFKSISPYFWAYGELTKWMNSQAYNNNDILLFPPQNWKKLHRIKCSGQFRISKRDTDCFEHLHQENTKPSVNESVSHAWIFLATSDFLWFLQSGWEEWWSSNIMEEGCWCSPPPHFPEKSVFKLRPSEGRYEKYQMRNKTKSATVRVTQFLLSSLFYTWTFIKRKFFRI